VTTVGITGAAGFLGWHIRCRLHALGIPSVLATRETFADAALLEAFCDSADVIVHVAGVNRASSDSEVVEGNRWLALRLIDAMRTSGSTAPVVYMNSTQSEHDSPYGLAKLEAADALAEQCATSGAAFLDLILPHLFGEFGRPNYNSVVSTFAYALANDREVAVNPDAEIELVHAQDVAELVVENIASPASARRRIKGRRIAVCDVWEQLQRMHHRYVNEATVPRAEDRFELELFNTLRSQLFDAGHYPRPLALHTDKRGAFAELCRADGLGQTSLSTTAPGVTRGDHFHFTKIERFVVVQGQAEIRLRKLFSNDVKSYQVDGSKPSFIDMPPLATHNIINTGTSNMITVFWSGDHFDPENPDTYAEAVGAVTR